MPLNLQLAPLHEVAADWLLIGVWQDEPPAGALAELDACLGGTLGRLRAAGDLTGKPNELAPLLDCKGTASPRMLLVGLGKRAAADRVGLFESAAAGARLVTSRAYRRVVLALPEGAAGLAATDVALVMTAGLMHGCQGPGIRKSEPSRFVPDELGIAAAPSAPADALRRALARADVEGRAVALTRELVNMPPCDLYPETFADFAQAAAAAVGVECTVLDGQQIEAERMQALLGVARGSARPPRLVVLRYRGSSAASPALGLVGKGVTFDSGGLSLKDTANMLDMKGDMAGAATVLGAITASAELRLPIDLLGVLPLVENMPGSRALKLGDVLRARNGTTIEVLNTDAEGRLILADALAYAVDQGAARLLDLATLTGACLVALGTEVAGLMGNDDTWLSRVQSAARTAGERVWPLPMWPLYGELLKSDVADIKNVASKRWAGAIAAAKFLERFVGTTPWAHLDIAGPAWAEHESAPRDPGGTGAFVRTLVELAQQGAG